MTAMLINMFEDYMKPSSREQKALDFVMGQSTLVKKKMHVIVTA